MNSTNASENTKDDIVLSFLLPLLALHRATAANQQVPFILALTGLQGSGKSFLVSSLHATLTSPPHSYNVAVFSIDDLYYPFTELENLRLSHPQNKLLSHRGEPGTHDIDLAEKTFDSLIDGKDTPIPRFDKSLNRGRGDRVSVKEWKVLKPPVDIIIFEGWCVGFRAISDGDVEAKWSKSRDTKQGILGKHKVEDALFVNNALRRYDILTNKYDAFVHLDAKQLHYVYNWRLQQEHELWSRRGSGMTDEQVVEFVNGYIPGYELYLDKVRDGVITRKASGQINIRRHLRIVLGEMREVISSMAY